MKIPFKAKIRKLSPNVYGVTIPKAVMDTERIKPGEDLQFLVKTHGDQAE